jgi:hypothetical protein
MIDEKILVFSQVYHFNFTGAIGRIKIINVLSEYLDGYCIPFLKIEGGNVIISIFIISVIKSELVVVAAKSKKVII